uniref:YadA-like family protein n=4 Tax=Burkholderia multivorans TaxID=87883 RepID=UPI00396AF27B
MGAVSNRDGQSFTRQIVNVAAGTQDNDAVNLSQMKTALLTKVDDTYFKANAGSAGSGPSDAIGAGSVAIGAGTTANSNGGSAAVAVGQGSSAFDDGAVAIGSAAQATAAGSVAFGRNVDAYATDSVAVGNGAQVRANSDGSTAIGKNATVFNNTTNAVALGADSNTMRSNTVSVGSDVLKRQIINVAAGTGSNDAVIVSQLAPVVDALGGGASIDGMTGAVNGPTYNLANGGTQTTVGGALGELDRELTVATSKIATNRSDIDSLADQIGSGTVGLVQQSAPGANLTVGANTDGAAVDFAGTQGERKLTGVAAGNVAAGSLDAVNGSQLHGVSESVASAIGGGSTVNPDGSISAPSFTVGDGNGGQTIVRSVGDVVTNLDGRVTTNEGNIEQLADQIGSGTVGLVQQDATNRTITVAKDTDGMIVDFAGTQGERKLTGVAAGNVAAGSLDAVNGSQLHGVSESVASAIGGGATVNADGSISAPTFTVGDGNGGQTTVHTVGDVVTNLDGRVTTNEGDIKQLADQIGSGTVGLVQQNPTTDAITVGANTGGTSVNFAGTDGPRTLSGVANGTDNNDVVTIAQLKATGLIDYTGKELGAVVYDGIDLDSVTFGGSTGTKLLNVAPGRIESGSMDAVNGGQIYAMQQEFENRFSDLDGRVSDLETGGIPGNPGGPGDGSGDFDAPGSGERSVEVGAGSEASGKDSSAIGQDAKASGDGGTAIGSGSNASGNGGTAIGHGSNASGAGSTAIGQNANATGNNSVALGNGSVADRDNSVSVGSAGNERQITNVAAGTAPTDAVNVQQMQSSVRSARQDAMGGVAAAMAVAGLPQSTQPGRTFVSIAGSTYGGEYGSALGASYMTRNGKWTVKAAVNTSSRGEVGAVIGGGFYW